MDLLNVFLYKSMKLFWCLYRIYTYYIQYTCSFITDKGLGYGEMESNGTMERLDLEHEQPHTYFDHLDDLFIAKYHELNWIEAIKFHSR